MKNTVLLLTACFLTAFTAVTHAQTGISAAGTPPDASAMLDVIASDKGFLAPRVALLANNNSTLPIASPAPGLLVYNTATAGTAPNDVVPGYYYWNGVISRWERVFAGYGTSPTGSGTLNYVPKWTPSGTQLGNSSMYDDGNVGIGMTVPNYKLVVTGAIGIDRLATGAIGYMQWERSATNDRLWSFVNSSSSPTGGWDYFASDPTYNTSILRIQNNGRIGIGSATPGQKLDVNGRTIIHNGGTTYNNAGSGELHVGYALAAAGTVGETARLALQPYGHTGGPYVFYNRDDATYAYLDLRYGVSNILSVMNNGNVGIGTSAPGRILELYGTTPGIKINDPNASGNSFVELGTVDGGLSYFQNVSGRTRIHVGGAERMTFLNGGNVGINSATPGQQLDVAGNIKLGDNMMVEGTATSRIYRNLVSYNHEAGVSPGIFIIHTNQPFATDCMFRVKIEGYFYDATAPFETTVAAYNYSAASSFINLGYVNTGAKNLPVRLARNASGNIAIILGTDGASYSHPHLSVTSYHQSYGGISEAYADGWTVTRATDASALTLVTNVPNVTTLPTGSGNYIQNQIAGAQASSNFWISGTGRASAFQLNDANTSLTEGSGDALRLSTSTGYIDIGSQNTTWAHIQTDRPRFYFNKGLSVDDGLIGSYDEDMQLQTQGATRITVLNSNGNVGVGSTTPGTKLDVAGGSIRTTNQLISTLATGTAPVAVTSTTLNTNLNADRLDNYHASELQFQQSNRDFPNGTLIQTNINYAVTSGEPWLLEIEGNSYGNLIPIDLKIQGYIYYDSLINVGGISNGLNITGLSAFNYGGNLCFWFPTQGYWNGYSVFVNDSYAGTKHNRLTSITHEAKPVAITKEVQLTPKIRQSWHSGNFTPSSYAPVSGSGNYIQNQVASAQGANFWVSGYGVFGSGSPLRFTSIGSGTYNQTIVYHDATNGLLIERARTTDVGSGTITDFVVSQRGGGTPGLIVKGSGNVGINTATPATLLNVYLGAGDATVGTNAIRVGGTSNYPSLELGIKGAYDGMISTFGNDLHIYAGNWRTAGATASENHSISFYTSQNGSTNWNTAKMFLNADGNVGIGTTSPATKLQINHTSSGGLTGTTAYGGIHLQQAFVNDAYTGITSSSNSSGSQGGILFQGSGSYGTKIHFLTTNSHAAGMQNRMTLDHVGNLGIGTLTPGFRLHVYGPTAQYPAYFGGPDGYVLIGPANTSHSHFVTDRASFYFNTIGLFDTGKIGSYDEDLQLQTAGTTRITASNSTGYVGVGETAPLTQLHVSAAAGITTFTGTARGMLTLEPVTYATGNYSNIDFLYADGSYPCAKIGAQFTNAGSTIVFGTSNNYSTGITKEAMSIGPSGIVTINTPHTYNIIFDSDNSHPGTPTGDPVVRSSANSYGLLGKPGFAWWGLYWYNNFGTSDVREKTDIYDSPYGLKEVMKMRPVNFKWKKRPEGGEKVGLIAQEMLEIIPQVVSVPADPEKETYGISYTDLVPVLINAVKEQQAHIEKLEQMILEMKNSK